MRLCKDLKDKQLVSDHCQSEDLLSSSFINQHEAFAFDVQLEATAIIFRRLSIRTACRTSQTHHYWWWWWWTLKDKWHSELQMLSRLNTVQDQMKKPR